MHYLSAHPEGLREAFITGGLPPLTASADDYYRATYPVVAARRRSSFARYPGDEALARASCSICTTHEVMLPTGGRLTARRFQQLGFLLGFDEGMETLHYLLESAFCEGMRGRGAEPAVPARRGKFRSTSRPTRSSPRCTRCATRRKRLALVRPPGARRISRDALGARAAAVIHWRDDLSVDVRRVPALVRCARSRSSWRRIGLADAVRPREAGIQTDSRVRPRSTPKTCTCRASIPSRPPRRSAA